MDMTVSGGGQTVKTTTEDLQRAADTIGHNSRAGASTRFAKDQLKAYVERIERLEDDKQVTSTDIKELYAEIKGNGYDVKAIRTIIRLRRQDADERAEQEAIVETYMAALGMLVGTPLGDAAIARATS
jgi:uncharacterized protein (UPF0335 family)